MAASTEDWSCDSNQAIRVSLVQPDPAQPKLRTLHSFHPKFTYPIFGEEERIFGYEGLDIDIRFAAHDCRPHATISYDSKFQAVGEVQPTNCIKTLKEFMPDTAFESKFESAVLDDRRARTWTPPGEKIHMYERKGRTFELWTGRLSDVNIRCLLDQIQIFVLFFIEGGQMIPLDDPEWSLDRWQVYFLYEKTTISAEANISSYIFAGYATTYRFYKMTPPKMQRTKIDMSAYPNVDSIDLTRQDCRLRVSQVLILPPYQSSGHGAELFRIIYSRVMADETVFELTVEDPSEEFDRLRDSHDWKILEPVFKAANVKINSAAVASQARFERLPKKKLLDIPKLEKIRKERKIAPRQFYRALELYFLSQIPYSHRAAGGASLTKLLVKKHRNADPVDVTYYWLRLLIKQRIWRQNNDKFVDVPTTEIVEKVSDTTRGQEDEYEGYLLKWAMKASAEMNGGASAMSSSAGGAARKRKIVVDDDDDDGAASDASKKARSSK